MLATATNPPLPQTQNLALLALKRAFFGNLGVCGIVLIGNGSIMFAFMGTDDRIRQIVERHMKAHSSSFGVLHNQQIRFNGLLLTEAVVFNHRNDTYNLFMSLGVPIPTISAAFPSNWRVQESERIFQSN